MSTPEPTQRDEPAETATGAPAAEEEAPRAASRLDLLPSPVFVLILGLTGIAGWLSWTRGEEAWFDGGTVYAPFVLILGAWIVSITLHEYVHSVLAYRFGDRALRGSGYLRLNPFGFRELFAGLLMPVAFLVLGGFGMTGPALHLDRSAVGSRAGRSLIALAGPVLNLVLALALVLVVNALIPEGSATNNWLIVGLMYVCFLNVTAALINLLPVPGTDGFDAIAPYLPEKAAGLARSAGIFGVIAVFAVLWLPGVHTAFLDLMYTLLGLVGLNETYIGFGQLLFQFWVG
ncbi:Zn-dependent protease [Spinactinospora alkalitolerans]|uniref:Zn-dependent protease n=1 Tax=Spinactinospora alkalitolerans TaxID=687207 RepID=A0A852TP14_9ACTN|nr:site-2 protease family protein [Spinactinospora alkalitolerans]NYE45698.1 Zn-dependent protease [Spinactinospora alkalitolerans]